MKWVAVEPTEAALAQEMSVVGFVHKAGGQNALHGSSPLLQRRQLRVPKAINDMVIDHPSRLHKSVANRRPYELPSSIFIAKCELPHTPGPVADRCCRARRFGCHVGNVGLK